MYNGSTKFTNVRAKLCMCCRMSGHSKILISTSAFNGNYCTIINTAIDVLFAVVSFPDTAAVQALVDL